MNSMMTIAWVLIFSASAMAVETVDVGVAFRFGPEVNSPTAELYRGIEFAKEQFEKKNKMMKINLTQYTYTTDNASIEKVGKQILKDKVKYLIGAEMSEEALTLGDQFQHQKMIFITPTASNPRVTENKPNVFQVSFSDKQVALQLAKYVLSRKQIKSVGILHNISNPYVDYLTTEFTAAYDRLKDNQNKVQFDEFRYAGDNPQFEGAVKKFKEKKVDLVVAFTLENDLDAFFADAAKANFWPTYLGGDGWATNKTLYERFVQNQPVKSFVAIRSSYWNQESKQSGTITFNREYQKKYGKMANEWNAITYDSAMILFDALLKAKNKTNEAEVQTILKTTKFKDLATAESFEFNQTNSPNKALYLYEVSKNGIQFLKGVE